MLNILDSHSPCAEKKFSTNLSYKGLSKTKIETIVESIVNCIGDRPYTIATIGTFSVCGAVPWFARLAWSWRPAYDVMQDLRGPTLNASAWISIPSLHSAHVLTGGHIARCMHHGAIMLDGRDQTGFELLMPTCGSRIPLQQTRVKMEVASSLTFD